MDPLALTLALLAISVVTLAVVSWQLYRTREELANLKKSLVPRRNQGALHTAGRAAKVVAEAAGRVRDQGVSAFLMSSAEDFARWAIEDRKAIASVAGPNGEVTIFFSDIESSTALNEELGDKDWVRLLAKHDSVVRANVDRHHGHIVKSQGDGFMIVFHDSEAAIRAGIAIQRTLTAARGRRLRGTPIRVRIGIHAGSAIEKDGDYFGRNVAMAARVAAQAEGGEILVSEDVRESLDEDSGITLVEQVDAELKGFGGSHTLWLVDIPS